MVMRELFGIPMPDALVPLDPEAVREFAFAIEFWKQNHLGPGTIYGNPLR